MAIKQICKPEQCNACYACANVCAQGAIARTVNGMGEDIPFIDQKKCVSCGMCLSVCPVEQSLKNPRAENCYAAWSKYAEDLEKSSSGGIAAVLSRKTITDGGCVYGTVSTRSHVFFERVNEESSLDLLRGSKYVKSDVGTCYRQVKADLVLGKQVLFFGTPCQVAGVRSFVGTNHPNLTTVDLICHGTPPFSYLSEYLGKVTRPKLSFRSGPRWDSVSFRSGNSFLLKARLNGKTTYEKEATNDLYFSAFLGGMIFRENCYSCPYACPERVGDLTLGDFWGLDRAKAGIAYGGKVSVVLPNSEKGRKYLQLCDRDLELIPLPLENALNPQQGNLLHPSLPHEERNLFQKLYPKYGFTGAMKRTQLGKTIRSRNVQKKLVVRALRKAKRMICSLKDRFLKRKK